MRRLRDFIVDTPFIGGVAHHITRSAPVALEFRGGVNQNFFMNSSHLPWIRVLPAGTKVSP